MATTKKKAPHVAALATVNDLDEQEQAARAHRDQARARLADLRARNQSGDHTITGLDLMTATAEVEAAEGLADHAARMVAEARATAAALLAEHTSIEVRRSVVEYDLDEIAQEARDAVSAALARLRDTLAERDAASDAAGQALADAGVRPGQWLNGIRYVPARRWEGLGPAMPGAYNVQVRTEEGGVIQLAGNGDARETRREVQRILHPMMNDILQSYGLHTQPSKRSTDGR